MDMQTENKRGFREEVTSREREREKQEDERAEEKESCFVEY